MTTQDNKTETLQVEVKKTENLQGKEQLGLIITKGENKVVIQVGEKNYTQLAKMLGK